jgi:CDP-glucose 4,6-dehydratase
MGVVSWSDLQSVYRGRRVLVTGHTGFKGAWLTIWLSELGAEVTGYSLAPLRPSLFTELKLKERCRHVEGNLRDCASLAATVAEHRPEIVFHLAAQSLVRQSYRAPLETIEANILGTAHLLECIREDAHPRAAVIVTSDKCYANREWEYGYREDEPMGGRDVYSMSKGAAELLVSSYRECFFPPREFERHRIAIASARAGNVIGGGDWAADRIVPDVIRALGAKEPVKVRNADSVRPWQHVLEPLGGYLLLGGHLLGNGATRPASFCEAWNFGPELRDSRSVRELVEACIASWGSGTWQDCRDGNAPHESRILRLSIEKACLRLEWSPRWNFGQSVRHTIDWYRAQHHGATSAQLSSLCIKQIHAYLEAGRPS